MSVVRIPRPEDDAFPWLRAISAAVVGGALGLGLAYWGMERDPAGDLMDEAPPAENATREVDRREPARPAPTESTPEIAVAEPGTPELVVARDDRVATDAGPSLPAPELATPPIAAAEIAPPAAPVMLRPGRVAYLRCEGVPQREGPFPCPRDEPLEAATWEALRAVEGCARSPGPGQADVVLDFGSEPEAEVRARDTFPPETARTDAAALLECVSGSLAEVRTSLRASRLVVSFRLTLITR